MSMDPSRKIEKSNSVFINGATFPSVHMDVLEGHESKGEVELKPLMVGNDLLMIEIHEKAGVRVPVHSHDDHESVVYLVKGKMKVWIGDEEFLANAGDAWMHPIGVSHWSETLEDSIAIEIKSPPRKTWVGS